MAETREELLERHKAEISAFDFVQADADASMKAAEATMLRCVKCAAEVGLVVQAETMDSQYVTIVYPTNKTGAEGALWVQIIASIEANTNIKTSKIRDPGTIRVRSDHYEQVFDAIEAALPLQEDV